MNRVQPFSLWTAFDVDLFRAGHHVRLYEKMGAHPVTHDGLEGIAFAVWAPAAHEVRVVGDFNFWSGQEHQLFVRWDGSGIWEGLIPGLDKGSRYKFLIRSDHGTFEKGDPFARSWERPPHTASVLWWDEHAWTDRAWMSGRHRANSLSAPLTIYEVHAGSWRWDAEADRPLTWREMAECLPAYVRDLGFTHVEFMPVMEYPYDPSWGYQIIGYFAPTSRFGTPEDFKYLVDTLHQAGIGVILDWVPSHFPEDAHGLGRFDGSAVYEHPDPRRGWHPDWKSLIFNYGRPEVRSFLISNALFWLDRFHIDGLRVDAVASMLYLDYSREGGEWEPNIYGGRENLEAIGFMKDLNEAVYGHYPDAMTLAEESTAFPGVTRPVSQGGLGFGLKWMMGWMNDTLRYFQKEPVYRKFHQNDITFSLAYAFTENFVLPLSHDEVVYGKQSLLSKMPGDDWQKFANLRLLFAVMYAHPGSKLIFQGGEFGQWAEWDFSKSLDWHLTEWPGHAGIQALVRRLNRIYRDDPAFHTDAYRADGFEWIDFADSENSVIAFLRQPDPGGRPVLVVANFTPVVRENYRIGCPSDGEWIVVLNSDQSGFGGSGLPLSDTCTADPTGWHGRSHSLVLTLPPLGALYLAPRPKTGKKT